MSEKRPSIKQLSVFRPLDTFSEEQMVLVSANSEFKYYDENQTIIELGSHDRQEYFLIDGTVELESFDGRFKEIQAGSESAKTAIALLQPRKYTVRTKTPCCFARIKQETVESLIKELPKDKSVDFSVSDLHSGHEIADIARSFELDLKTNNIKLPSFPEVALRIRALLDDPNVTPKDIADALKSDPAITVKILKTCNSVLYRTPNEITSSQDAIVRLGFDTTRQLVTIFAMKDLFKSKNGFLQQKMGELWNHSREVASIAYVLAKITPGMNPELALLAGLIQDVGTIPVYNYIERYPQFMKLDYKVDQITQTLKREIGISLMEAWGFQKEIIEVVANSENWKYQSLGDAATYADLVVVAQVHTLIGKKEHKQLPPFNEIPAFRKLGDHGLTPEQSQEVLHQSHDQINDLKALLSPVPIPVLS